ncbi:unnamed protein product [Bursaphelenchus xylophilus]|uniref:(pine wood nematode) hypothetical protein n=1 Tax=Bursaphelenchus xylophilus TaxID=6326 RepID=A0A1I7SEW7_BURXY|nr:unnamed protein product [Bursaphelenchus xylophilus]CAG9113248.1 unnamed protein product [Bursaphelenchus xylophilus]
MSAAGSEAPSRASDAPEIVVPAASAPHRLWKRGAVVGMLRNMLSNGAQTVGFHRQLSDIDTTRQDSLELEQNSRLDLAFDDHSLTVLCWEILIFLVCMYNLFAIPFPAFDDLFRYNYQKWMLCNVIADVIFLLDLPAQCFVAIFKDGLKERNVKIIGLNYIKRSRFIMDLIAVFPMDLLIHRHHDLHMLRVNSLAKSYRILKFLNRVQMHTSWPNVIVMAKVIIPIVFIFHWNACGYFALSLYFGVDDSETNNWPFAYSKIMDPIFSTCNWMPWDLECTVDERPWNGTKEEHIEELFEYWENRTIEVFFSDLAKKYALSIYWSSMTITTLGEQPEPDNSIENLYEILNTVIGILIFGAIMGSVAEIVQNANRINRELRANQDLAKIFMQNRKVEEKVQRKVFNYFDFTISEQWVFDDPTSDPLLTTALRQDVRIEVLLKYLREIPLFKDTSEVFLQELVMHFHTQLYGPGDYLCTKGDVCRELFIVEDGVLIEISKKEVKRTLRKGDAFGELSLMYQPEHRFEDRRHTSLISVGFSEVFMLPVDKFRRLLQDFPVLTKELDKKTREMLAVRGLLRSEEDMMNARYREQSYHDVNDRLLQIKKQLATLNFGIGAQTNIFKRKFNAIDKRMRNVEQNANEYIQRRAERKRNREE